MSNFRYQRKNEEVQKAKGRRGLRNLGNTCFMNAAIQVLSNCEPFRKSILQVDECIPNERDAPLTKHLSGVIRDLWEGPNNEPSDPRGMFRVITRGFPQFQGYRQQDAQDFSRHLLEGIHQELKDCSIDSSMISDLFTGRYRFQAKCDRCSNSTDKEESFRELPISVNSGLAHSCEKQIKQRYKILKEHRKENLNASLREFTLEKRAGIAQCSCGCITGNTKITVTDLPEILVITLKWENGSKHKKFEFPDLLDMSKCVDKYKGEANTCKYHLFASVKHSGSEFGGHYKAFCKNDGKWFLYDDECCMKVDYKEVQSTPYSLYYRKAQKKSKYQGKQDTIMTIPHAKTSAKELEYMDRDKDQKLTNHQLIKGGLQHTWRDRIKGSEFGWSSSISKLPVHDFGNRDYSEWEEYNKLPEVDGIRDIDVSPSWFFKWKNYAEKGLGTRPGPIEPFDMKPGTRCNPMMISYAQWSFLEERYGAKKYVRERGAFSSFNREPLQKKPRHQKEEIKLTEKELLRKICETSQFEMYAVDMQWFKRWRQYVENRRGQYFPGEIKYVNFDCDIYRCVKKKFTPGEDFVPLYQEDFYMLIHTYGGTPLFHDWHLQNRFRQKKSIHREEEIRVREKNLLSKVCRNHQFKIYAVEMKWFEQWKHYIETLEDKYHPGQIDNWGIGCDNCQCVKEEFTSGVDFVILYQGDWDLLIGTYGGGPRVYAFHPRDNSCRRFYYHKVQASLPKVHTRRNIRNVPWDP